jgi:hypothetical protein
VFNQKTEVCLFYRQETASVSVLIEDTIIKSKTDINVLRFCLTQNCNGQTISQK